MSEKVPNSCDPAPSFVIGTGSSVIDSTLSPIRVRPDRAFYVYRASEKRNFQHEKNPFGINHSYWILQLT